MKEYIKIEDFLDKCGVYPNLRGYDYLIHAVELVENDLAFPMIKLYKRIGEEFATTGSKVERAIRHALSKITTGDYRRYGFVRPPNNGELIHRFARGFRVEVKV